MRRKLLILCLTAGYLARATTLALSNEVAVPGQTLVAALSFASEGQSISGLQFDIDAGPGLSLGVLPGAQIGAAVKVLHTATLPNHALRVVVVGMNLQQIADGELLRPVAVVDRTAQPGSIPIHITNALATDVNGNAIDIPPLTALVQVQSLSGGQSAPIGVVVNAASLLSGPVSPGEIVTIFGAAELGSVSSVQVNGTAAPLLYAGAGQVNAIVPFGLDPAKDARLDFLSGSTAIGRLTLAGAPVSPALFTVSAAGSGPGAVLNQDYTPNSFTNPAPAGSAIMLYGTGFGALNPPASDGEPATGIAATALPVTATIGGISAKVLYAGAAPGLVAGVVQINVQIPLGLAPSLAAPVSLVIGGVAVAPGVTISTQ